MNCNEVRDQIALHDLGALEGRETQLLEAHLAGCAACRQAQDGHRDLAALLASYEPPALPDGFQVELRERLQAAGTIDAEESPRPTLIEPRWRRGLKAAALLAAGVAVGALGLWWARPTSRVTEGPARQATAPEAIRLAPGEVAVVTLVVHAERHHPDARLEVVLPDGLALVGEGLTVFEEKQLRWTEKLRPGANRIRVPVQARRKGTWQVVARVQAGDLRTHAQARLVVTSS